MHDGYTLSLLSGSKDEWNRVTSAIISDDNEHAKRDALILSSMNKNNTNETILEDSFIDVKVMFGLQEADKLDEGSICKMLQHNKATKLISGVHSLGFSNLREYLKELQFILNTCKPTMHTFFELAYNEHNEKSFLIELEEW